MEKLRHLALQQSYDRGTEFAIYTTGGGVMQRFEEHESADVMVIKLRAMADSLEESVKRRNW